MFRRFHNDLSNQNWLGLFLDFIIVVVGLFVGLQIDGWNEDRKNTALEHEYLEQLQIDFSKNIESLELMGVDHEAKAADLMRAIGIVKSGKLAPEDEEMFKWAIMTMKQVPPMSLNMAGYRALVAAGDFSLLSDRRLRSLLVSIESEIEFDENAYWRNMGDDLGFPRDVDISWTVPHPSGRGVAFEVDFTAILAYSHTLGTLANARRAHSHIAQSRHELRRLFLEALSLIDSALGPHVES